MEKVLKEKRLFGMGAIQIFIENFPRRKWGPLKWYGPQKPRGFTGGFRTGEGGAWYLGRGLPKGGGSL